jgi:hypothetical protein
MAKSSGKRTKIKVPKRVAGVKIPKTVRKGPVLDFVNSSTGRLLIAEALTAAVGIFAAKQIDPDTGKRLKDGVGNTEDALKQNTARLSYAFGEGVRAFRHALAESAPVDDTREAAEADASEDDPLPAKKKPRSSRNEPSMPGGL